MTRFNKGSRAPQVMAMHKAGISGADISRQLGISDASVSKTIKRHTIGSDAMWVPALPREVSRYLIQEAGKSGVKIGELARAFLIDAVNEEINAKPVHNTCATNNQRTEYAMGNAMNLEAMGE